MWSSRASYCFQYDFYMCRNWGQEVKFIFQGYAVGMWPSQGKAQTSSFWSLGPCFSFALELPGAAAHSDWYLASEKEIHSFSVVRSTDISFYFPCHPWLHHSGECFSIFEVLISSQSHPKAYHTAIPICLTSAHHLLLPTASGLFLLS